MHAGDVYVQKRDQDCKMRFFVMMRKDFDCNNSQQSTFGLKFV